MNHKRTRSSRSLGKGSFGDIAHDPRTGAYMRNVGPHEWEPMPEPEPYDPFTEIGDPAALAADDLDRWAPVPEPKPGPAPGSLMDDRGHDPEDDLDDEAFAAVTAEAGSEHRADGWTAERRRRFLTHLADCASVQEAARQTGMTRQSARRLYRRAPAFRAAWDEALRESVSVLAETAFHRAVHGTQTQVYHQGQMVGFREVHHDGLLTYLLRVRDPLNFAPIDELERWTRLRGLPAPAARALPAAAAPAALPPASTRGSPLPLGLAEPAGTREPTEPSPPA